MDNVLVHERQGCEIGPGQTVAVCKTKKEVLPATPLCNVVQLEVFCFLKGVSAPSLEQE